MKRIGIALLAIVPTLIAAQPARDDVPFSPLAGFGQYRFGGDVQSGPALGVRLAFLGDQQINLGFTAGLAFRVSGASRDEAVPLLAMRAYTGRGGLSDFQSGPDNYANYDGPRYPRMSLALGFLGPDVTVYFAQGDVRPYAGVGAQLILFPYTDNLAGAVAPDVRAGLDVRLSSGLSGFAEIRHAFGIASLVSPSGKDFRDLSIFAFGLSFVPRFD